MAAPHEFHEVRFQDQGSEPTEPVRVTPQLAELLARAALSNRSSSEQPQLTFGSVLAAFSGPTVASSEPDEVVEWVRAFAAQTRANLANGRDPSPLGTESTEELLRVLEAPLTRSVSARRALDEAVEVRKHVARELGESAGESNERDAGPLDTAHLFAAFLWLPQYHPEDFARIGLDVSVWQGEFARAMAQLRPAEAHFWSALAQRGPDSAPTQATVEPRSGRVLIGEISQFDLAEEARALFDAAVDIALKRRSGVVTTRSLLSALLDWGPSAPPPAVAWFLEAMGDARERWPAVRARYYRPSRGGKLEVRELTADAAAMLSLAGAIAHETRPGPVQLRHLVAAILLYQPPEGTNAHKLLRELGCEPAAIRSAYLERIVRWGQDDNAAWTKLLSPSATPTDSQPPTTRPNWGLARIVSDRVSGRIPPDRDHLDAKRPALRFAKLLCARDVEPPIALGLFGNWGTGKSFFMGLMQSYVDELTKDENRDPAYVRRAAQIDFNAWHYQDTNLWASLALRIFEALATQLAPKQANPTELEKKKAEINQTLDSSTQRKAEASTRRDTALVRRAQKTKLLEQKLAAREQTLSQQLENAWQVAKKATWFEETVAELQQAAQALGVTTTQVQGVKDVLKLRDELRALTSRGHAVIGAVATRFQTKNLATTLLAILLVATGSVGFGWLVTWLDQRFDAEHPIPGAAILAQLTAVSSTTVGWLSRQVRRAQQGMERAEKIETQLRETARQLEANELSQDDREGVATKLRKEIGKLDDEIRSASEELSEAERQITEATAEIERIESGGLVYDFLRERGTSTQYQGQLGLVSMLRRDLLDLGRRLSELPTDSAGRIDRIILYIDDLDRCQPAKVVEVLQAVHLLLAFPYFHVVVGVDARWLRRSLEEAYQRSAGGVPGPGEHGEFSAHDYLEKIFQIPYALAPLQKPGFEKLIDGMLKSRTDWTREQAQKLAQERASREAEREAERQRKEAEEFEKATRAVAPRLGESKPQPGDGTEVARTPAPSTPPPKQGDAAEDPPVLSNAAPVVFFEDHEEAFIKGLHEFIDRPRLAGRFVNIYRLLRARAAEDPAGEGFAATAEAIDYRVVLVLLAVNVGRPRCAGNFFTALRSATSTSWDAFLNAEIRGPRLATQASAAAERRTFEQLRALPLVAPQSLDDYRRWIEPIVCFSFDLPGSLAASVQAV